MRIGICTDLKNVKRAAELGYDYVEVKLSAAVNMDATEFEALAKEADEAPIHVEKACILLPKTMRVIGPEYDEKALDEYLEKAFQRMKRLGADTVSFGSGKCRAVPEGMDAEEGFKSLVAVTRHIGDVASRYSIRIAVEPLNRGETNLVTTVKDGDRLVREVAHPWVGLLADAFHMRKEEEPMSVIASVVPLWHAHIATKDGRGFPTVSEETKEFMDALAASGYKGDLSIEAAGTWNWEECSTEALKSLRTY